MKVLPNLTGNKNKKVIEIENLIICLLGKHSMLNGVLLVILIIVSSRLVLGSYFKTCNNIQLALKKSNDPNNYFKTLSKFDILLVFFLKPLFIILMMVICMPVLNGFEIPELKYIVNFKMAEIDFVSLVLSIILAVKVFMLVKNVYMSYVLSFISIIWAYYTFYTIQNNYLVIFAVVMISESAISFFMVKDDEK
ncbi:hypothetical protein [Shewanella sp.]|uniref:hypothetical protein n=1 Tax=Shewanella sp. TaxID=50422 RepID=UPI003F66B592